MSKKIETAKDIMDAAAEVLQGLRSGKLPVEAAQAQIRAINTMNGNFALRLEHARLTGRLIRGNDVLPDTKLDASATPSKRSVIEMKPEPKKLDTKKTKAA